MSLNIIIFVHLCIIIDRCYMSVYTYIYIYATPPKPIDFMILGSTALLLLYADTRPHEHRKLALLLVHRL